MSEDQPPPSAPGGPTSGAGEIIAPFSWGTGPRPRTVPTEIVMRAIRDDDYAALLPSGDQMTAVRTEPRASRKQRRPTVFLVLASAASVLGGISVLGVLWIVSG